MSRRPGGATVTGPRRVRGASVADFTTHLGGFGAHGTTISTGSGSVVPPKGSQNETKRLQQRSMEREGENDQVRSESRLKNPAGRKAPTAFLPRNLRGFREIRGFRGRSKISLKIVAPKPKIEPSFGLEMQVGRPRAA